MPPQSAKPGGHILVESEIRLPFDRDVVVVIDPAQVWQLQMSCDRCGLIRNTFHQVAIAADRPHVEVKQLKPRLVVPGREPSRSNRHPDAVATSLPQRPRRRLDSACMLDLRMARRLASPLPKVLDLFDRQRWPI